MKVTPEAVRAALDAFDVMDKTLGDYIGLNQFKISRFLNGGRKLSAEEADKIREFFAQYTDSQKNDSTQPIIANSNFRTIKTSTANDVNLDKIQRLSGTTMPVYPSADAGREAMIIDPSPIDYIPRPADLENEPDAFGVLVTGECMVPEYNPGEYAYIHPRKPPMRGKACLLTTEGKDGEWLGSLKLFVRSTDNDWVVRTHEKPKTEMKFSKDKWPKCLRAVGKWDGR